jgi:hypothetical protein
MSSCLLIVSLRCARVASDPIAAVRATIARRVLGEGVEGWARRLALRNRWSRSPVVGDGPIVSLTSHGPRVSLAHLTIESIAAGAVRPSKIVLWLNDEAVVRRPPAGLRRLRRRGLEIRLAPNHGPHTKYFPALPIAVSSGRPLVTADDDMLYPPEWLAELVSSYAAWPDAISTWRARTVQFDGDELAPYLSWPLANGMEPTPLNFITGVSGVLYPPRFVAALLEAGEAFADRAPKADDVWLHFLAVREGVPIRQIAPVGVDFPTVPDSQGVALQVANVVGGLNDRQIAATYTPDVMRVLRQAARAAS